MNGNSARNELLLRRLLDINVSDRLSVGVCPPFPYLAQAAHLLSETNIRVGAQNMSALQDGAHTGEVSAAMLVDVGCSMVIIGHSERRALYGDTDALISAKLEAALAAGLQPVLCVGETLAERESGGAFKVVEEQVRAAINGSVVEMVERLVVAYEPIWAIGTGKTATPELAQEMHRHIRSVLDSMVPSGTAPILYGGSVNAGNANGLFAMPDIDGALVGGASLDADGFIAICEAARV